MDVHGMRIWCQVDEFPNFCRSHHRYNQHRILPCAVVLQKSYGFPLSINHLCHVCHPPVCIFDAHVWVGFSQNWRNCCQILTIIHVLLIWCSWIILYYYEFHDSFGTHRAQGLSRIRIRSRTRVVHDDFWSHRKRREIENEIDAFRRTDSDGGKRLRFL